MQDYHNKKTRHYVPIYKKIIDDYKKQNSLDDENIIDFDYIAHDDQELSKLKSHAGTHPKNILLLNAEPKYFNPGGSVALQWIEFKNMLLEHQIFNCDFYVTTFWTKEDIASLDWLNTNAYHWRFHNLTIDVPHIPRIAECLTYLENDTNKFDLEQADLKFSYLNRTHRSHRQILSKFFIKHGLHKENLVAINNGEETHAYTDHNDSKNDDFKHWVFSQRVDDDWLYNQHILDLWRDTDLVDFRHSYIETDSRYADVYLPFLKKACINIVSETVFNHPAPTWSEKIAQPILAKRPFIVVGPQGSLKQLRDLGFKTFNDSLDESYDEIPNPNERMESIMQEILRLNKLNIEQIKLLVKDEHTAIQHNFDKLKEKIKNFTN